MYHVQRNMNLLELFKQKYGCREQEKLRLLECGLDDKDLEELRVVFKWAKLFSIQKDFWD